MVLSSAVQYAVIIITMLKSNPNDLVPAYKISRDNGLSSHFVDQICRKLRNAGIVKSNRGPGGGYSLIDKDREVTVYDLMNILTEVKTDKKVFQLAEKVQTQVNRSLNSIII